MARLSPSVPHLSTARLILVYIFLYIIVFSLSYFVLFHLNPVCFLDPGLSGCTNYCVSSDYKKWFQRGMEWTSNIRWEWSGWLSCKYLLFIQAEKTLAIREKFDSILLFLSCTGVRQWFEVRKGFTTNLPKLHDSLSSGKVKIPKKTYLTTFKRHCSRHVSFIGYCNVHSNI